MKTISSKAGTRLARARKSEIAARHAWELNPTMENGAAWSEAKYKLDVAGEAVADELVAQGFADAEGDDA